MDINWGMLQRLADVLSDATFVIEHGGSITSNEVQSALRACTGLLWKEVEIDFGEKPVYDALFTITDVDVTSASHIAATACGKVASGRIGDDWAWDGLLMSAVPLDGSFLLTAITVPGPVVGKRVIQYQIG